VVQVESGRVEDLLAEGTLGHQVYEVLAGLVDGLGPTTVRTGRSQVAFRRRTGFCWVWLPGRYLAHPAAEVVVSLALPRHDDSPRWKESLQVTGRRWMHHLEVHGPEDLDEEVLAWLAEAYGAAD
jgi:hypothetical protein